MFFLLPCFFKDNSSDHINFFIGVVLYNIVITAFATSILSSKSCGSAAFTSASKCWYATAFRSCFTTAFKSCYRSCYTTAFRAYSKTLQNKTNTCLYRIWLENSSFSARHNYNLSAYKIKDSMLFPLIRCLLMPQVHQVAVDQVFETFSHLGHKKSLPALRAAAASGVESKVDELAEVFTQDIKRLEEVHLFFVFL